MATVADWPDGERCKRAMTKVDSRNCADGPVWLMSQMRKRRTSGANDVRPKIGGPLAKANACASL
jgi:hypothetical protein